MIEADLLHGTSRSRQVDLEDRLHGSGPRRDDHHLVGQPDRFLEVVRDEQHRRLCPLPTATSNSFDMIALVWTSSAENGSSINSMRRLVDEGGGQTDALAHAAGQLMRVVCSNPASPTTCSHSRAFAGASFLATPRKVGPEGHVGQNRLPRQQGVGLEDEAGTLGDAVDGLTRDPHCACARADQGRRPESASSTCRSQLARPPHRTRPARRPGSTSRMAVMARLSALRTAW